MMIFFGSQLDDHDIWTITAIHMKTGIEVNRNLSDIKRSMRNYKHGNDAKLLRSYLTSIMYTESVSK